MDMFPIQLSILTRELNNIIEEYGIDFDCEINEDTFIDKELTVNDILIKYSEIRNDFYWRIQDESYCLDVNNSKDAAKGIIKLVLAKQILNATNIMTKMDF